MSAEGNGPKPRVMTDMKFDPKEPHVDFEKILLTEDQLEERTAEIAIQISEDYEGKFPLLVGVMTGAIHFFSSLVKKLTIPSSIDTISASSYGGGLKSSGNVAINDHMKEKVMGRHIIVVEDIIETGNTYVKLKEFFFQAGASSVKLVSLLDKPEFRSSRTVQPDYVAHNIPSEFVMGYGLDVNGEFRTLPYVGTPTSKVKERLAEL